MNETTVSTKQTINNNEKRINHVKSENQELELGNLRSFHEVLHIQARELAQEEKDPVSFTALNTKNITANVHPHCGRC